MKPKVVPQTHNADQDDAKRRRQIWISNEVFEYIAKQSRPLVDTPDSTLRRMFGLAEKGVINGKDARGKFASGE